MKKLETRNKKYISFSLWGNEPIYNVGIIRNIELAKQIYIGWEIVVYLDDTVPLKTIELLKEQGLRIIKMNAEIYGMFWRFMAADLQDCKYAIFRDCDSRLSEREYRAVNEWMNSGKSLHIMRDHPYHHDLYADTKFHILGGMWGIKGGLLPFEEMISSYSLEHETGYGSDQFFLNEIYHKLVADALIHDSSSGNHPYPDKRKGYRFIGEKINEFEMPANEDWKALRAQSKLTSMLSTVKKIIRRK